MLEVAVHWQWRSSAICVILALFVSGELPEFANIGCEASNTETFLLINDEKLITLLMAQQSTLYCTTYPTTGVAEKLNKVVLQIVLVVENHGSRRNFMKISK